MSDAITDIERGDYANGPRRRKPQADAEGLSSSLRSPTPEGFPAQSDAELGLRLMLACCYAGVGLYRDDGELQDNRTRPFIDFRRDSVEEIDRKMTERFKTALAARAEAGPSPSAAPPSSPEGIDALLRVLEQAKDGFVDMRDMVLNERGPLAEMGIGSDAINAVLGIMDDNWPAELIDAALGASAEVGPSPRADALVAPEGLLPCPFCGGEADTAVGQLGNGEPYDYVECIRCGAMSEPEWWNRRAAPHPAAPGAGEVTTILTKLDEYLAWQVSSDVRNAGYDLLRELRAALAARAGRE